MTQPISWVIAGGESGPRARPAPPAWFRSLRDQCAAARVPFLFKQWGSYRWAAGSRRNDQTQRGEDHGIAFPRCSKQLAGRMLDGRTWDEVPAAEIARSPADAVAPAGRTPWRAERRAAMPGATSTPSAITGNRAGA